MLLFAKLTCYEQKYRTQSEIIPKTQQDALSFEHCGFGTNRSLVMVGHEFGEKWEAFWDLRNGGANNPEV